MTDAIGPGDWVECITSVKCECCPTFVTSGHIYCVSSIGPHVLNGKPAFCSECGPSVECIGLTLTGEDPTDGKWCPTLFRPIYRPKPGELKRQLLHPFALTPRQYTTAVNQGICDATWYTNTTQRAIHDKKAGR